MTGPAFFDVIAASRGVNPWSDCPPAARHDPAQCAAGHPDGAAFCGACGFVADEHTAPNTADALNLRAYPELDPERH